MKFLVKLALVMEFWGMTGVQAQESRVKGLPLPWPFPWAKECPMNWDDLGGDYLLADTQKADQISIRISVVSKNGLRVMRVSRYSPDGSLSYDGVVFVTQFQKIIRVYLSPVGDYGNGEPLWAVIKMHFASELFRCGTESLVPIMTIKNADPNAPAEIQYRMKKVLTTKTCRQDEASGIL